jgi:hypothetical protein
MIKFKYQNKFRIKILKHLFYDLDFVLILPFVLCQLCFVICAYAENDLSFNVPVPPNTSLLYTKELRMMGRQIMTNVYATNEDADGACDYYRNFFHQQDFQKIIDKLNVRTKKRLLRFKKDELVVSIAVLVKEGEIKIVVAKYLEPAGALPIEKVRPSVKDSLFVLPKEDLPGRDLAEVPRPPESVRITSRDFGATATIMYTTTFTVESALDFYRQNMPSQWVLARETAVGKAIRAYKDVSGKKNIGIESPFSDGEDFEQVISDGYVLNFIAGSSSAQITIFPNFIDRKLGSMVQIVYSEK